MIRRHEYGCNCIYCVQDREWLEKQDWSLSEDDWKHIRKQIKIIKEKMHNED